MENSLLRKLQIKPGSMISVVNAPKNTTAILDSFPLNVGVSYEFSPSVDAYLIFATTQEALISVLNEFDHSIIKTAIIWVFYPKAKSKLASGWKFMPSQSALLAFNLAPCRAISVDETWTGMRLKAPEAIKRTGLANAEITKNAFGQYINVAQKKVTLPDDVKDAFIDNPEALAVFEHLAYSHKKEYILDILKAKREETRTQRIVKMINSLNSRTVHPIVERSSSVTNKPKDHA